MRDPALTHSSRLSLRLSSLWLLLPVIMCIAGLVAGIVYIRSGYYELAAWYRSLDPEFYRSAFWQRDFFTPGVYETGKVYAAIGCAVSIGLVFILIRSIVRREIWMFEICWTRNDSLATAALLVFYALIWSWGLSHVSPGFDEVFSALNCSRMHPFQCASYYMLPNNHVFFNLLNVVPARLFNDPILSARLISGLCGFLITPLLYRWLRSMNCGLIPAVAITAALLLQFPVWAFSFQGRGYMLYLLCAWVAFISLQHYFRTRNASALLPHAIATIVGFWTIPSYLYWELAIVVYALFAMSRRKRIDLPFLRAKLLCAASVFLAYSPVLCFSGMASLSENQYVSGSKIPVADYLPKLLEEFRGGIDYASSGLFIPRSGVMLLLLILPLAVTLALRRRKISGTLFFTWISWICLLAFVLVSQRFPFQRSLIAHVSILLASMFQAMSAILRRVMRVSTRLQGAFVAVACLAASVHFAVFNRKNLNYNIYYYPADTRFKLIDSAVSKLPPGTRVGVSDESFYWEYLCTRHGLPTFRSRFDQVTHYIYIPSVESLPQSLSVRAGSSDTVEEYTILNLRPLK